MRTFLISFLFCSSVFASDLSWDSISGWTYYPPPKKGENPLFSDLGPEFKGTLVKNKTEIAPTFKILETTISGESLQDEGLEAYINNKYLEKRGILLSKADLPSKQGLKRLFVFQLRQIPESSYITSVYALVKNGKLVFLATEAPASSYKDFLKEAHQMVLGL